MHTSPDIQARWRRAQSLSSHCSFDSYAAGREHYGKTYAKYFEYTGVASDNMNRETILEIGCGHFPGASYCKNLNGVILVDPINSGYIQKCANALTNDGAQVVHCCESAEYAEFRKVDEIWIFNVLSHVIDPSALIEKCKRYAKTIRFFEPINIQKDESNLNSLTLDFFRSHFGDSVKHYPNNKNAVAFHQQECAYGVYKRDKLTTTLPPSPVLPVSYPKARNTFNFKSIKKYCVSLRRSIDRRVSVSKEFKKIGEKFEFFDAVDGKKIILPEICKKPPGVYACMQSHLAVIRMAKEKKLPFVCVFEDDVVFCDDFQERIKYLESLPGFDFDILCLGGHFSSKGEHGNATEWDHVQGITRLGGTYGYIFSARVYDFILRNCTYEYGADEFYGTHVYKRFRSFAFVPFLVGCMKCKSEITGAYWEYENIGWTYIQESMNLFRKEKKDVK